MYHLSRELALLGHTPVVYCESDHDEVRQEDGVKVIYWKGPKNHLVCKPILGHKSTWHAIHTEHVDFIHYNAWPPSLAGWLARLSGIPFCMEGHGLEWKRTKYSPAARRIMKFMEWFTAKANRNLVMCSKDQVDFFKREYGRDSVCIHGAVTMPEEARAESDILSRYGLQSGKYFLFLGRLVQDKNPDYLIRAFRAASHSGFSLAIAGDNPSQADYVAHLHDLAKDAGDVVFTGAVYGNDKMCLLENAYCFCMPSTIEGLSIVMLEAASRKLPVIASDIEANREFLGGDAVYVAPECEKDLTAAIEHAISDPSELEMMAQANYNKILEEYTWDKVAATYSSYVTSVASKSDKK